MYCIAIRATSASTLKSRRSLHGFGGSILIAAAIIGYSSAFSQDVAKSKPNHWGYDFPRSYDAEIAAPDVHEIHYKDAHIMLMEVSNPPGYQMQMHGHPYPSVFARNADNPPAAAKPLDPKSALNGQNWRSAPAPKGLKFPTCTSADPQAPHMPSNTGTWPLHFYRIEFVTMDQDNMTNAKKRYASYPQQKDLFEDDTLKLIEITLQPGKAPPKNLLPGVFAFDSLFDFNAVKATIGANAGLSEAPAGMAAPLCITTGRGAVLPRATAATGPIHFYMMAFKRIDGADLEANWRQWYPHMVEMQKGPLRP